MSYRTTRPGTMEEEISLGQDAELRLILVGKSGGGKSATGNTILGRPVFKSILEPNTTTLKCQRGEGSWRDRKISVVDTPDIFDSDNHSEIVQNQIAACVELSRPGPHALIFVTQVGHFTAEDVTAAKRVREIFEAESAKYTIVLFTYLEDLRGESLQEYVQNSNNRNLQALIQGCGNRFCGFNNKAVGAEWQAQVSELMELVQRVVSENGGRHYVSWMYDIPMTATDDEAKPVPDSVMDAPLHHADGEREEATIEDTAAVTPVPDSVMDAPLHHTGGEREEATIEDTAAATPVPDSVMDAPLHHADGEREEATIEDTAAATPDSVMDAPLHPMEGEWGEVAMEGEDAELRLILVGKSGSGKSATGNTILGWRAFESILEPKTTLKCQRGQGTWQGRKVSVVDTPDIFNSKNHNESVRCEIGACVELSRPGPHALIFVTQVGRFTAEDVTVAKRVWEIFGDESARHTIVLFTCLENLGGIPLQDYLRMSDNLNLRELIWQCGNRFCGFNNKAAGAEWQAQVSELMEMVQRVVSENGGSLYVNRLHEVPETLDLCCAACLEMAGSIQEPERRIVLVGKTGNGKSATGNSILGGRHFVSVMSPKSVTATCQKVENTWNGRKIMVVDTPGFFDTKVSDKETAAEVKKCVSLCNPGPHVILQVMRPGRFSKEEKKVAKLISKIFSLNAKNYMILLFTRKEDLEGMSLENFLSQGDDSLKRQIKQCGQRYLAFNNKAEGEEREEQMAELMTMIDWLVDNNGEAPCYTEDMMKKDGKHYKKCSIL